MTIGSILLATALLVIVGMYVFRPILAPTRATPPPSHRQQLEANKAGYLAAIKQLELDGETGKIPDGEYQQERTILLQAAANTLRQLDGLPEADDDIDTQIEAAIKALRAETAACTSCGAAVSDQHQFCPTCGAKQ